MRKYDSKKYANQQSDIEKSLGPKETRYDKGLQYNRNSLKTIKTIKVYKNNDSL